jgi:glycosyltransferase involved in cell wall biosynthesis
MISDVYFPRVNGVSTSIQTFRRDLAKLGCETWLIAPHSLALGVPVVSTAVLGTKEVLRHAAGAIVAALDVTQFTAAVVEVLTQPALREALSKAGRQFVA